MSERICLVPNWTRWARRTNLVDEIDEMEMDVEEDDASTTSLNNFRPNSILHIADRYANDVYQKLSTKKLYPIRIVKWRDPLDIWIRLESMERRVKELDEQLQWWYASSECQFGEPLLVRGTPCAFKEKNRWRRGMINTYSHGSNTAIVRFVDKGGDRFVDLVNLRPLLNVFADVPPSAVHVKLFGVQMAELTHKLIKTSNTYFKSLGKRFACRFVTFDSALYSLDHYKIELYEIDRLGDYRSSCDLDWLVEEIDPKPDDDIVARSGLFSLSRGKWKNYQEEVYNRHRVHKSKVPSRYEDSDSWDEEEKGAPGPVTDLIDLDTDLM